MEIQNLTSTINNAESNYVEEIKLAENINEELMSEIDI